MKVGIFGVGRIGRVHAQILLSQGQEIVCIGDDSLACCQEALKVIGLDEKTVKVFGSAEEMASSGLPELVVVASHTKDHSRHGLPFVKANIPLYMEKPLTADLSEAFDFTASIGDSRQLMQIGLQRRFDKALTHAKSLIQRGLIGNIREIRCVLRDQFPPPATYVSPGLIIDMGIHVADEAIWLLDEFPNKVWAQLFDAKEYNSDIEGGANTSFVTFTTPSGTIGRLDLSRTHSSGYNNETYIIGTKGTIHVGRFAGYPTGKIPVELWTEDGKLHKDSTEFEMSEMKNENYPEFLPRFLQAYQSAHISFRESLEKKSDFQVSQRDILDAQVFVEAAAKSAEQNGKPIELTRDDDIEKYKQFCKSNGLL